MSKSKRNVCVYFSYSPLFKVSAMVRLQRNKSLSYVALQLVCVKCLCMHFK